MSVAPITDPARSAAYRLRLTNAAKIRQRWLLLSAGLVYMLVCLWLALRVGAPPIFSVTALQLGGVTFILFGFTFARTPGPLIEINPSLMVLAVGAHALLGAAVIPDGNAVRAAFIFDVLMLLSVIAAPTLRASLAALALCAALGAGGALFYVPAKGVSLAPLDMLGAMVPMLVVASLAALCLENERRASFELKMELERRATSDELTGVSNRAHISLLAQNEFARARRYKEPFSCLMIEIDDFDGLTKRGAHVANVVVQVFSGYCVVVMRHCDSFGRLAPARFLGLLPETQGAGAQTLADRMCRDLASLEVMVEGEPVKFGVSIGTTALEVTDRWASDMLRRAEQGLEDAIERGRGIAVLALPHAPFADTEANSLQSGAA